ncbi:auxin-responsive protein IAA1-like [Rutidosis leptorrhynchoides]|uniref:auxin-responsive protein IAA1-like n=1 Tax=Rutidosis leptorrhynchoides TaxID=125765 RepID=UPI003A9A55C5
MSSETSKTTSEIITELSLCLPGESRSKNLTIKRKFSDFKSNRDVDSDECSDATKPSTQKELAVGWPPVNLYRKNAVKRNFKFVKVAVDGAPYLRKIDLESYSDYRQFQCGLEDIYSCFTIENILNEKKLMDGIKYVTTYEDKDGDWMLVGDVPWKMFVETCRRIRLMRNSDNAQRRSSKCSVSSC